MVLKANHKRKRKDLPMVKDVKYKPKEHQKKFHQSPKKYRAMVAGIGSGKTTAGAREVLKWTQLYPGGFYLIGRLTATSLKDTTMRRFFEEIPDELIHHYNSTEKHLWLKTAELGIYSEIIFRHLDEAGPLGSLDLDGFWIDEAHEMDGNAVPESVFKLLISRLRGSRGPHRGIVTTNSGGQDWVWKYFFSPQSDPEKFYGVTATTRDNEDNLPPGYYEELKKSFSYDEAERYLEASFEVFSGQIFTEFNDRIGGPHVVEDFEVPEEWEKVAGFDFGVAARTAVVIGAVDPENGVLYITETLAIPEAEPKYVAGWMKARGTPAAWADPSTRTRGHNKESPAMVYSRYGISLLPADNDVHTRILTIQEYLRRGNVKIFASNSMLIYGLKNYKWAPQPKSSVSNYREKPLKKDDHEVDAFGYLLVSLVLPGFVLDPIKPGKGKQQSISDELRHPSLDEDEDNEDELLEEMYLKLGG